MATLGGTISHLVILFHFLFHMHCMHAMQPLDINVRGLESNVHLKRTDNSLQLPLSLNPQVFQNTSPPSRPLNFNSTPRVTILQDLERCSEVMGVSEESLSRKRHDLARVSRRAELFVESVNSLLPPEFLSRYKNPCWVAEKPNVQLDWNKMLFMFFRSGPKVKRILSKSRNASQFISKPVGGGHSQNSHILCLPHFFLAGFPKSATTTVHEVLRKLPQIAAPAEKEPHWWTRALDGTQSTRENIQLAFTAYTLFFETIRTKLNRSPLAPQNVDVITYDGSQSMLWDSNFYLNGQDYCAMPAVVSRVLPNAKFIVVMRNPITRLHSHFLYSCQVHYGSMKMWPAAVVEHGSDLLHLQVERGVDDFNKCLETMSEFECASVRSSSRSSSTESVDLNQLRCGVVWHRLSIGLYSVHIKKWLQFYPLENFLFIKMEDISASPWSTISRITDFLNIEPVPRELAETILGTPQNSMNAKLRNLLAMDENTRVMLERFYQPYNEELAKMLNDDRFLWGS